MNLILFCAAKFQELLYCSSLRQFSIQLNIHRRFASIQIERASDVTFHKELQSGPDNGSGHSFRNILGSNLYTSGLQGLLVSD